MADIRNTNTFEVDSAMSFTWAVDIALRSDTCSDFGTECPRSYGSLLDSAISSSPASSSALLHRSFSNQRSFRVKGIDRSLGLSGPENFAIPAAAWEQAQAHKARVGFPLPLPPPPAAAQGESGINGSGYLPPADDSFQIYDLSPNGSGYFRSWQKGEILGQGSFGTVYEGFTDFGFFFAVKEVSLWEYDSQSNEGIFRLQQEISLLSQFRHDNIVRYLGTDKDNDNLYMLFDLVPKGSLASLYKKYRLRDSQVANYTRQILSGLKYLHDRNVVYRDLKCDNILVDANGSVKLFDFGLAKESKLTWDKLCKCSVNGMAPEVVNSRNHECGLAANIWSLGCTVLEMLTRQPPYSHLEGVRALFRIGRGELPPVPDSLSTDARNFILKCLQVNPNERPTAAQLLNHPFVNRPILSPIIPVSPIINLLLS